MSSVASTGFILMRLADRITALNTAMQAIFGPDINIDPNSIDGQTLGTFAESIANLDLLAETIYQSFDPSSATGAALSRLVTLNGITRKVGTYSLAYLTCSGTNGTVIPVGSLVTSVDGSSTWETLDAVTIDETGTAIVMAQCSVLGPVVAASGTLTVISTPLYGWLSVTNASAVTVGTSAETDEELRIRRAQSTSTPAQGIIDAVYGAILNVTGVTQAVLYENASEAVDANGLPPHSMNLVVSGGADADIANTLWTRRSAGSTQVGAVSVTVNDSMGNPHVMKFDRPTPINIYVVINGNKLSGFPASGVAQIQAAVMAWADANLEIGDEVIQSALYTPINTVSGVSITSVYIGTAPAPNSSANVPVPFNATASFDPSRITVNIS
jgi:uncharacterized phage protein gp47/JayE